MEIALAQVLLYLPLLSLLLLSKKEVKKKRDLKGRKVLLAQVNEAH